MTSRRTRKLLILCVLFMTSAAVLAVLLMPALLSAEAGRRVVLSRINRKLAGEVHFTGLSAAWRSGITVEDISYRDEAGDIVFLAEDFTAIPSYRALLRGRLELVEAVCNGPQVLLNTSGGVTEGGAGVYSNPVSYAEHGGREAAEALDDAAGGHSGMASAFGWAGRVEGAFSVSRSGGTYKISSESIRTGDLSVMQVDLGSADVKIRASLSPGDGSCDLYWDAVGDILSSEGNLVREAASGHISWKAGGNLRYDWQDLSAVLEAFRPEGFFISGEREDYFEFSCDYPEGSGIVLDAISGRLRTGFGAISYMGLSVEETELEIDAGRGIATLRPFETSANGGRLRFACEVDLTERPLVLRLEGPTDIAAGVEINEMISDGLMRYVNPLFADNISVSGTADLSSERISLVLCREYITRSKFEGVLSVDGMRLGGSGLLGVIFAATGVSPEREFARLLPARFVLASGVISYDNMEVEVGRYPVTFRGVIRVEDGVLDMEAVLPYTTEGKKVRTGEPYAGKRLVAPLGGTINNPRIDVTGVLTGVLLQEGLRRGLELLF